MHDIGMGRADVGALFGWSTPWLFQGFNRVYGQAERAYHRSLAWVLGRRRLIMPPDRQPASVAGVITDSLRTPLLNTVTNRTTKPAP